MTIPTSRTSMDDIFKSLLAKECYNLLYRMSLTPNVSSPYIGITAIMNHPQVMEDSTVTQWKAEFLSTHATLPIEEMWNAAVVMSRLTYTCHFASTQPILEEPDLSFHTLYKTMLDSLRLHVLQSSHWWWEVEEGEPTNNFMFPGTTTMASTEVGRLRVLDQQMEQTLQELVQYTIESLLPIATWLRYAQQQCEEVMLSSEKTRQQMARLVAAALDGTPALGGGSNGGGNPSTAMSASTSNAWILCDTSSTAMPPPPGLPPISSGGGSGGGNEISLMNSMDKKNSNKVNLPLLY